MQHGSEEIATVQEVLDDVVFPDSDTLLSELTKSTGPRFRALNKAVSKLVDGFGMVSFTPLDLTSEDRCARKTQLTCAFAPTSCFVSNCELC